MTLIEQLQLVRKWLWELFHPTVILWQDKVQENAPLWGFDQIRTDYNGITIIPSDEGGANVSRVPKPSGEGFCLRLYGNLSQPGSGIRAQAGFYGSANKAFNDAATSPGGVYVSQKCYFPRVLSANGDPWSWLDLQDFHVKDTNGGYRSYFGMNTVQDGSMRTELAWGGPLYKVNQDRGSSPPTSKISMPVGREFTIKTHFIKSTEPTTIRVWFDDELALQWDNVINSLPSNTITEAYLAKLYGGVQIHEVNGVQVSNPWGEVERFVWDMKAWAGP
jgi:hypothetical protein